MPLQIYIKGDQSEPTSPVVSLSFEVLAQFDIGIDEFRKKTGIRVSEYDDCKLSRSQMNLLVNLIEKQGFKLNALARKDLNHLKDSIMKSSQDAHFVGVGE